MLTKASTRSKPYASLSTATLTFSSLVFVLLLKESFIRKRFCKPHWDERLNSAKRFFWKKRIHNEWFAHAIAPPDDSTHVTPLPSVSKIESFSLLIMVMVHGSEVMVGAGDQFTGRSCLLTRLIFVRNYSCTYQDPHRFLSWTIWSS